METDQTADDVEDDEMEWRLLCLDTPAEWSDRPMAEDTKAGTSARLPGPLFERRYGEAYALEVVEMEGEVASRLSHSSLQYARL